MNDKRRERVLSRDHDTIISVLSKSKSKQSKEAARSKLKQHHTKPNFKVVEEEVMRCISANIVVFVLESERRGYVPSPEYECFNDDKNLKSETDSSHADTLLKQVQARFTQIHTETQMEYECMVVALLYMERLPQLTKKKFRICHENWKCYMYTCMLLASKVWDDFAVNNFGFSTIFPEISLARTNEMEIKLLLLFDFNVEVPVEKYFRLDETIQRLIFAADLVSQLSQSQRAPSAGELMLSNKCNGDGILSNGDGILSNGDGILSNGDGIHRPSSSSPVPWQQQTPSSRESASSPSFKQGACITATTPVSGIRSSSSYSGLSRFFDVDVPTTEEQSRLLREQRNSRGSRSSKEEILDFLTRTRSGDWSKDMSTSPLASFTAGMLSTDLSALSNNGIAGGAGGFGNTAAGGGGLSKEDDKKLHEAVFSSLHYDHDHIDGEWSAGGDRDGGACRGCVDHCDSDGELAESYDEFRDSNLSQGSLEGEGDVCGASLALSESVDADSNHGTSPTPSLESHASTSTFGGRRLESIERRVSKAISVLIPHFPSLSIGHAKIYIDTSDGGDGAIGAAGAAGTGVKEEDVVETEASGNELGNIGHFPSEVDKRRRAYSMSTAHTSSKSGGTTGFGGSFNSKRRTRVHAIDGDPSSTSHTHSTDSDEVLASISSMTKDCEDVLEKLRRSGAMEGEGRPPPGGLYGRKGRSVSYTEAKTRDRHEAYNYSVMQSGASPSAFVTDSAEKESSAVGPVNSR